jgi:RHS repeat-associated protein
VMEQVGGIKTNRIASVNGTAFSYDAGGNVTGDGAGTYAYDAENRIVSVSGPVSESYGYDAGNRRVKKEAGGVVTHYIWEGGQVIAEYERGGSATPATGTRYYHQDRLSTRIIADSAGAVVGTTDQLPFGEEAGVSGEEEKHKFTTYERDNTGLHYAVNRHYDPQRGRFNQVDPLGLGASSLTDPQSLNLYNYVRNDPVNAVDPTGLIFCFAKVVGETEGPGSVPIYSIICEDFGGGGGGEVTRPFEHSSGGGGGGSEPQNPTPKPATVSKCKPTFDQFIGADRKSGIANDLLNPLGVSASYTDATDEWHFKLAEPKPSLGDFEKKLAANGWEQFITDPNNEHKGFYDYKKNYEGNWYHFSVKPSTSTVFADGAYGVLTPQQMPNPNEPPVDFSLHFEEATPGGLRHGVNFGLSLLTKAANGIGMTIAKEDAAYFEHLPPCK